MENTTMPESFRKPCQKFLNDLYIIWAGSWMEPHWRDEKAVNEWWGRIVQAADEAYQKAHASLPESEHDFIDHTILCMVESIEQRVAREKGGPTARKTQVERLIRRMGYQRLSKEEQEATIDHEKAKRP